MVECTIPSYPHPLLIILPYILGPATVLCRFGHPLVLNLLRQMSPGSSVIPRFLLQMLWSSFSTCLRLLEDTRQSEFARKQKYIIAVKPLPFTLILLVSTVISRIRMVGMAVLT